MKRLLGLVVGLLMIGIGTARAEDPPDYVTSWSAPNTPVGICVDNNDYLYVVNAANPCHVRKFNTSGSLITIWGSSGTGDGQFQGSTSSASDGNGYIYVVDRVNWRIQKFTDTGTFVTKWGSNGTGNGQFRYPSFIEYYGGYLYVTDRDNHRIQKFDTSGNYVAQWGSYGTGNGQFNQPVGIGVDSNGYIYVADTGNQRIQKFSNTGTYVSQVSTSPATPTDICGDANGNIFAAMSSHQIRKYTGSFSLLSSWGSFGSGDNNFYTPQGLTVDSNGDLYIVDSNNLRVKKYSYGVPSTPDSSQSTILDRISYVPPGGGGTIPDTMVIRDQNGDPMSGVSVTLTFSDEADSLICWCSTQSHPVISGTTDSNGQVIFIIYAGGSLHPDSISTVPITIAADSVVMGYANAWSPDIVDDNGIYPWNGWSPNNCGVGNSDAIKISGLFGGGYNYLADFDGDGDVDLRDAQLITPFIGYGSNCSQ